MNRITEFDIIQNSCISALALHKFTDSFSKKNNGKGPTVILCALILPLVFNKFFLDATYKRKKVGGLFNAFNDHPELAAGMQERMIDMADQTFEALGLTFTTGILNFLPLDQTIIITHRVRFPKVRNLEIKKILQVSDRLGCWFSEMTLEQICILFKVRF